MDIIFEELQKANLASQDLKVLEIRIKTYHYLYPGTDDRHLRNELVPFTCSGRLLHPRGSYGKTSHGMSFGTHDYPKHPNPERAVPVIALINTTIITRT